jgi:hypothetical protein
MSEKDSPESRSRDIGYGFVDSRRPRFRAVENGSGRALAAPAYGPGTEGAGTRVCGYVNKEE